MAREPGNHPPAPGPAVAGWRHHLPNCWWGANCRRGGEHLALAAGDLLPEQKAAEVAINAGACGALLGLLKLPLEPLLALFQETFKDKGPEVVEWNRLAATQGHRQGAAAGNRHSLAGITAPLQPRLLITGHEAVAVGALAVGVQFLCGYPMTPWSSVLNAIGQRAEPWGVVVEQAEDEIAAINMAIGASYGGVRSMTATSGGGFALMVEALGLAGSSETPLVIVESQRPGPTTGLPTQTEQGDLSFVLSAGQGDFPGRCWPREMRPGIRLDGPGLQPGRPLSTAGARHHGLIFRGYRFHPRAVSFSRGGFDRACHLHRPG